MNEPRLLTSKSIYEGKVVKLRLDRVDLPNGHVVELEVIRHQGAAAVVPIDQDGCVLMVRQYRHATGGWILEVPAGKLDAGEEPDVCARREVEEETGHRSGTLEPLGWIWTTPGFTDERIWLYLARDLTATAQRLEDDEVLTVERVPIADAVERAARGQIADGKSVCALLRAARVLGV